MLLVGKVSGTLQNVVSSEELRTGVRINYGFTIVDRLDRLCIKPFTL